MCSAHHQNILIYGNISMFPPTNLPKSNSIEQKSRMLRVHL